MATGYICFRDPITNVWGTCTQNFVRFSTNPRIIVTVDQYEAEDVDGRLALDEIMAPFGYVYCEVDPHDDEE